MGFKLADNNTATEEFAQTADTTMRLSVVDNKTAAEPQTRAIGVGDRSGEVVVK